MIALFSLFSVIFLSFVVIKIAAILFELTGVSQDIAEFQALSAFTGTGFTSSETESIVNHPSRRNIAKILIIFGNAGVMTIIATLILTFVNKNAEDVLIYFVLLSTALVICLIFLKSDFVHNILKNIILKVIDKYSSHDIFDYHEILGLGKGFVVSKIYIDDDNWMSGKELKDLKLDREGTLILSIEKYEDGKKVFQGAPNGKTIVQISDILTCYGRPEAMKSLADREKGHEGEQEHIEQCKKLKEVEVQEES